MENDLAVMERGQSSNDPQPVGQFFTLPAKPSETLPEIPKEWIDRLFARLWAWYGKAIEEKWGADIELAKSIWREDLAGLSTEQLKAGMAHCRDSCKFPPSLPEFRNICLTGGKQIDAEVEWRKCVSGRYECLAHYWAVQEYGYAKLHNDEWREARFQFPRILRDMMLAEQRGELGAMPQHVRERLGV